MVRPTSKISLFLIFLVLQGCLGGANYAPIIERREKARYVPHSYIVKRGDTLYSIAWRYSLEVKQLASTNGIGSSYLIYPGQKLLLKKKTKPRKKVTPQVKKTPPPRPPKPTKPHKMALARQRCAWKAV